MNKNDKCTTPPEYIILPVHTFFLFFGQIPSLGLYFVFKFTNNFIYSKIKCQVNVKQKYEMYVITTKLINVGRWRLRRIPPYQKLYCMYVLSMLSWALTRWIFR